MTLDEGPRADTSAQALAKLKPAFAAKGSVTAGNSSQTSDGAGALLPGERRGGEALQPEAVGALRHLRRSRRAARDSWASDTKEAIPVALRNAGLKLEDIDWIELNEAFAAQALAVIGDLGLDRAKVNPMGGAIALGPSARRNRRDPLGHGGGTRCAGAA